MKPCLNWWHERNASNSETFSKANKNSQDLKRKKNVFQQRRSNSVWTGFLAQLFISKSNKSQVYRKLFALAHLLSTLSSRMCSHSCFEDMHLNQQHNPRLFVHQKYLMINTELIKIYETKSLLVVVFMAVNKILIKLFMKIFVECEISTLVQRCCRQIKQRNMHKWNLKWSANLNSKHSVFK